MTQESPPAGGAAGPGAPPAEASRHAGAVGGRYWDAARERMPVHDLGRTQIRRLRRALRRAYDDVPFYRRKLDGSGVAPERIDCHGEAQDLPFTTPAEVLAQYPFGLLAVPRERIVCVHAEQSGDGIIAVAHTREDLEIHNELTARALTAGGLRRGDLLSVCDAAGVTKLSVALAAERLGATVLTDVPADAGRRLTLVRDLGVTALVSGWPQALDLAGAAADLGLDPDRLPLRVVFCGYGRCDDWIGHRVGTALGVAALGSRCLPAVAAPSFAYACLAGEGMHINEDHFLAEVVDPRSLATLPEREVGELVVTTLSHTAMPLIRYRTGLTCSLIYEPCACGRTFSRMTTSWIR